MSVDAQGSQMVAAQSVEIVGQLRGPGNRLSGGSVGSLAKKCRASVGRESGPHSEAVSGATGYSDSQRPYRSPSLGVAGTLGASLRETMLLTEA